MKITKITLEIKGSDDDEKKLDELVSNIERLIVRYTGNKDIMCMWNFKKKKEDI